MFRAFTFVDIHKALEKWFLNTIISCTPKQKISKCPTFYTVPFHTFEHIVHQTKAIFRVSLQSFSICKYRKTEELPSYIQKDTPK